MIPKNTRVTKAYSRLASIIVLAVTPILEPGQAFSQASSRGKDEVQAVKPANLEQSVRSLVGPRVTTPQVDSLIPTRIPGFELRVLNSTKQVRINLNKDGRLGKDLWLEHMLPIYIYYPVEPAASLLALNPAMPSAQPPVADTAKISEMEERLKAMEGSKKLDSSVRLKKLDQMEQLLVNAAATTPGDQSDFDNILHLIRELKIMDGQTDIRPKEETSEEKDGSKKATAKVEPKRAGGA